jgi:hypothetical protein
MSVLLGSDSEKLADDQEVAEVEDSWAKEVPAIHGIGFTPVELIDTITDDGYKEWHKTDEASVDAALNLLVRQR